MFSVPKINIGKSFERPAKILRGLGRFCENLTAAGSAGVWTFYTMVPSFMFSQNDMVLSFMFSQNDSVIIHDCMVSLVMQTIHF